MNRINNPKFMTDTLLLGKILLAQSHRAGRISLFAVALLGLSSASLHAQAVQAEALQLWEDQLVTLQHTGYAEGWNADKPIERKGSGGQWHIAFTNTSNRTLVAENLTLDGVSFQELKEKFQLVWWRTQPPVVEPGESAMLILRWRSSPSKGQVEVGFRDGSSLEAMLPAEPKSVAFRLSSYSFDPESGELLLYWLSKDSEASPLSKVVLNGKVFLEGDRRSQSRWISQNFDHGMSVARLQLPPELSSSDYVHVVAKNEDGEESFFNFRLGDRFFPIGTYDMPGKVRIPELVEAGANMVAAHSQFSVSELAQLHSVGLQALEYTQLKGPTEQQLRTEAIHTLITVDEPDVKDWSFWNRQENQPKPRYALQAGQFGQAVVDEALRIKEAKSTMQSAVLVNLTIRPWNWYEYGQTTDVFIQDNYVLTHGDPIDFITTVQRESLSAAAPFPVWHVYDNAFQDEENRGISRPKTASEMRRIMQLAVGSGARGMLGWWNVDYKESEKRTYFATRNYPDKWAAQSKMWRELDLLSPLLSKSFPWDGIQRRKGVQLDALVAGDEALVLSAVNMQFEYSLTKSLLKPIQDLVIECVLPGWIEPTHAWKVHAGGALSRIEFTVEGGRVVLPVGELHDAGLYILTSVKELADNLTDRFEKNQRLTASQLLFLKRDLIDSEGAAAGLLHDLKLNRSSNLVAGSLLRGSKGWEYTRDSLPTTEPGAPNALDWYEKPATSNPMGVEWELGMLPEGRSMFCVIGSAWGGDIEPVLSTTEEDGATAATIVSSSVIDGRMWVVEIESPIPQAAEISMLQAKGRGSERGGQFARFAWFVPGYNHGDLIQNLHR